MDRRAFLARVGTVAAAVAAMTVVPLQHFTVRSGADVVSAVSRIDKIILGDIAREVARFSQGTSRFVQSKTGFAPNVFTGGDALGWIENARGVAYAWVDRAQRIHWDSGDITRVFQR